MLAARNATFAIPRSRASAHGVRAEVDADRVARRYRSGEIGGDGAGTASAVDEPHPGVQLGSEKRSRPTSAAGMHGAVPLLVYLVWALRTRPRIGHALLFPAPPRRSPRHRSDAAVAASFSS
jgi:hypothetical protein